MSQLLSKIDLYGVRTELFIGKDSKFRSPIGGFCSLVLIASGLLLFFLMGQDMINSSNPQLVTSEIYNPQPAASIVGKNGYFFIFGMENSYYQHFWDESIYDVFLQNITIISNETASTTTTSNIPIERCTEDHLPSDLKSYFLRVVKTSIGNLICVKKGYEFEIEGSYDSFLHKYIALNIKTCQNSTTKNITCKSQEVIDATLQQSYFGFYSNDFLIDTRNHKEPGAKIGRDYFMTTTPNIRKGCVKYLASYNLVSDEGWIVNNEKISNYTVYSNDKESFEIRTYKQGDAKTLFNMLIRKMNYEKIYTRKYKKIQNVFADMGGFLNIVFMALYLLTLPFNSKMYYHELANKLFNFEKDKELVDKEDNLKSAKTILDEINDETTPNENAKTRNKKEKVLQDLFKSQEIPLKLSFWDNFKAFFKKNEKVEYELKQSDSAMKKIFENLDIGYILKKILEIEKLKILLLDESQYHLFELLPKPLVRKNGEIQINSNKIKLIGQNNNDIITNKDYIWKAQMIRNAYDNINSKAEKSELDDRLLRLIDEDLKHFFEDAAKSSKLKPSNTFKMTKFLALEFPKETLIQESEMQSIESEHLDEKKKMEVYHN